MAKRQKKSKQPKHVQSPIQDKHPKHDRNPENYQRQLLAWHFHKMDGEGAWQCNHKTIESISERLHQYEQKRWNEVACRHRNHAMPVNMIEPEAQRRLAELGIIDVETLY